MAPAGGADNSNGASVIERGSAATHFGGILNTMNAGCSGDVSGAVHCAGLQMMNWGGAAVDTTKNATGDIAVGNASGTTGVAENTVTDNMCVVDATDTSVAADSAKNGPVMPQLLSFATSVRT